MVFSLSLTVLAGLVLSAFVLGLVSPLIALIIMVAKADVP